MSDQILDHTRDLSGRETHRLLSLYPAPDFVKSASHEKLHGDPETMARNMYADPLNKLYPCHTAAATWMSSVFFADKRAEFTEKEAAAIETRLTAAANYFGVTGLINQTMEKVAADATDTTTKLSDDYFAIVWESDEGIERHWPLRNKTEVKFAAAHFDKYRDDFTFEDRHKIANKILDRALQCGAPIGEYEHMLEAAAGRGACAAKIAAQMLHDRAMLARRSHKDLSDELLKMSEIVLANPDDSRTEVVRLKLASIVDTFDRETKLYRLYDEGGLPRPEEVLFGVTEKMARDFTSQHVQTTTGNIYDLDDLEKLAVNDVRDFLGDDFLDAVSTGGVMMDRAKLAVVVPTLDRGMAAMLDRLLQDNGASPAVKTAEEIPLLTSEALYKLAAEAGVE